MTFRPICQGATVVFGGQAGSEGKGAIVGYMARKFRWSAAICQFMTNAGHTWIGNDGEKVVVQQLPMAVVSPDVPLLLIGAASAITLPQLEKEINLYDADYNVSRRLRIHPRAMIIESLDAEYEKAETKYIASTAKGCGRALARKAMRSQDVRLARDIPWLKEFIADTTDIVQDAITDGHNVLVEGCQGFDLDINHGIDYPHCTSRQTTPMQTLADCGIASDQVSRVIAVVRSYPIRVGNVVENNITVGYSGDFGGKELTWEEITRRSGSPEPLAEYTTVTKRLRRVFEIDYRRLVYMAKMCRPTDIALTFADYLDWGVHGSTNVNRSAKVGDVITHILDSVDLGRGDSRCNITLTKTGPADGHIHDDTLVCDW